MKKFLPKSAHNPSGFTLVELLVVVAIIAVLSVIGITIFTNVQKNARDAKRRGDVGAISKALEAHYKDVTAPCSASDTIPYCVSVDPSFFASNVLPANPGPGGAAYSIIIPAARTTYTVCALLENNNGNSSSTGDGTTFIAASGNAATHYCNKNQQ